MKKVRVYYPTTDGNVEWRNEWITEEEYEQDQATAMLYANANNAQEVIPEFTL